MIGGRLADAWRDRALLYAISALGTGAVAVALFVPERGVTAAVALGVAYGLVNGVSRPALVSLLSATPPEVRGTVLGINITCASVGWVTSAIAGGALAAAGAWGALGWTLLGLGVAGAALGMAGRK
jgi:predicted MFS family arabinose efflux permease